MEKTQFGVDSLAASSPLLFKDSLVCVRTHAHLLACCAGPLAAEEGNPCLGPGVAGGCEPLGVGAGSRVQGAGLGKSNGCPEGPVDSPARAVGVLERGVGKDSNQCLQ